MTLCVCVCVTGKKCNSFLVGLETLHVDLSFHRSTWLWGQSHLASCDTNYTILLYKCLMSTRKNIFLYSFVPFKRMISFLKTRRNKHCEMKWSLSKKILFLPPQCIFFFSFLIEKNKIPRFLKQYDLFQHFCCFAYLKIIFTTRLWDNVYIARISEMQPIFQCLEYFETLKLALSIWSVSMVKIEKWLDNAVYFHCQI